MCRFSYKSKTTHAHHLICQNYPEHAFLLQRYQHNLCMDTTHPRQLRGVKRAGGSTSGPHHHTYHSRWNVFHAVGLLVMQKCLNCHVTKFDSAANTHRHGDECVDSVYKCGCAAVHPASQGVEGRTYRSRHLNLHQHLWFHRAPWCKWSRSGAHKSLVERQRPGAPPLLMMTLCVVDSTTWQKRRSHCCACTHASKPTREM